MEPLPDIGMPLGDTAPVFEYACTFAQVHRMQRVGTESMLAALITAGAPEVASTLARIGVDAAELLSRIEGFFIDLPGRLTTRISDLVWTPRVKLAVKLAAKLAREQGKAELSQALLLQAIMLERESVGGQLIAQLEPLESTRNATPAALLNTVREFRHAARQRLEPMAYDYFASGADAERLKHRNRHAWDDIELRPRVLVDVSSVNTTTQLLGLTLPFPALIAPMAYQRLAHTDGELATAKAAAACGVPMIVSTMANVTLEELAAATPAPKWFQLYCHRDRGITRDLLKRAEAAGYRAIVLTVDAPVLGRRLADERNGFELPKGLTRANLAAYEERLTTKVDKGPRPAGSHLSELFLARQDPALSWQDLVWLRGLTSLPLILKGVLRGDDARRAADAGCAGVIVSNHGGRQLDASMATARALPEVVAAVAGRVPVLVDGAIEWGADILRALALGASAVLIGRPVLWGLAAGGEQGVRQVLEMYAMDFTRAMQLAGCASVADAAGLLA